MAFEEEAHRRDLSEVAGRDRGDLEPPLPFGDDQRLGREPVEEFAQRADARAVCRADAVEQQLLPGIESAKDDVGADPAVGDFADGLGRAAAVLGHVRHPPGSGKSPYSPRSARSSAKTSW